jgi:acyl-coenzyme A synthetase/AMP-(fatty) acid ligase
MDDACHLADRDYASVPDRHDDDSVVGSRFRESAASMRVHTCAPETANATIRRSHDGRTTMYHNGPPRDHQLTSEWVDDVLLDGPPDQICLHIGAPVDRRRVREMVTDAQAKLAAAGVVAGRTVAIQLPPSMAFVVHLLATWRSGAQACLLDHRLTSYESDRIVQRIRPTATVSAAGPVSGGLRGFQDVAATVSSLPGGAPADTGHALLQLSSGSTGPSKVIGRTAASLVAEVDRYSRMAGVPRSGERIVLLASMVHVLGLVGGLLYGLHAGVQVVLPERITGEGVLAAVTAGAAPTTLLGVPFHIELLASVAAPPKMAQLSGMTTGGELVRPAVYEAFVDRYGVRLGNMYGMTEVGVIATDLFGQHRPALAPAPGIEVRERDGELVVAMPTSPYVGLSDPARWVDGWLRTLDAGRVDARTGLVAVLGRNDSQVSIGGLKVDLTEVEQSLLDLPEIAEAVVVYDRAIEAYVVLTEPAAADRLDRLLTERLAGYKRPRMVHVVDRLPRTTTGKLVRDGRLLRASDGVPVS